MSRFIIKDTNTKFKLMCGNTSFVFQDNSDYTEYDVLKFTFNEETGDYQCWIENPSVGTQRAFERDWLRLGISTCDIVRNLGDKYPNKTCAKYRKSKKSTNKQNNIYWRSRWSILIDNINGFSFNINKCLKLPEGLWRQGQWYLKNIDKYGWPESGFKNKLFVEYKFILIDGSGRAIKTYKNIYSVELDYER
jgi:hypothetical protein